jgi:hypothetical protein
MEILGQDIDEVLHVKKHAGLLPAQGSGEVGWHGEVMCRARTAKPFPPGSICLVSYDHGAAGALHHRLH